MKNEAVDLTAETRSFKIPPMLKKRFSLFSPWLLAAALSVGVGAIAPDFAGSVGDLAFADEAVSAAEETAQNAPEAAAGSEEPVRREANVRMTNADFPTQMRSEPDGMRSVGKIPPGTKIKILDMRVIQVDRFKENWYLVEYENISGWVRGDDLDGETSEKSYSVTYQAPDLPGASLNGVSF